MNLYFECNMGASGDMLGSALLDLFDDRQAVVDELNSLSLPHTQISYETKEKHGINGAHLNIVINGETETPEDHHHHHHHHAPHRKLEDIFEIIDSLSVDSKIKQDIKEIYLIVAKAEAKAHNAEVGEVHFHELGMLDAIADITICSFLINKLSPERIICSPVNVGNGTVNCAHGVLSVPAPATAEILKGVPFYKSEIQTELCTPTGAALLKYFTDEFTESPSFNIVKKIGTGCGTKDLERANILRVFLFEDNAVTELSCNIDDMTGEEAAYAAEKMMNEGARDCFITPVFMKKGRPAYLFTVICDSSQAEKFASLIFRHTSTIGIRKYTPSRYTLERTVKEESGVIIKRSEGFSVKKEKIEFEEIKKLAEEKDISVFEARKILENKTKR